MALVQFLVDPHAPNAAQNLLEAVQRVSGGDAMKSYPHPHYGRPGKRGGSTSRANYAAMEEQGLHWTPKRRVVKPTKEGTGDDKDKTKLKPVKPKHRRKTRREKPAPKPVPTPTPIEPEKPKVKTAAEVRATVIKDSAGIADKVAALDRKMSALHEEYNALKVPKRVNFADYNQYGDAYDEYVKKVNAMSAKQKKFRAELATLKSEMALKVRPHLYVEQPLPLNYQVTRTFSSKAKKKSVEDALAEFSKMVGVSVASNAVDISAAGKQRAHYQPGSKAIRIGPNDGAGVVVHEMGHWLEDVSPEVHEKAVAFLERRTANDTTKNLRRLTGMRYRGNEVTKPDKFIDPYIGKDYISRKDGKRYATEVISMGLEYMYSEPWKLASEDPEMFDFIYDTMRGN